MLKLLLMFVPVGILSLLLVACSDPQFSTQSIPLAVNKSVQHDTNVPETPHDIILVPGDQLVIDVYDQQDLEQAITIDTTGHLYYSLAGRVKASGLTVDRLKNVLEEKLAHYYVDPKVIIQPVKYSGELYYVLGEIKSPGSFALQTELTVFEAVANSGGLTNDASDYAVLLRKSEKDLLIVSIPLRLDNLDEKNIASVTMEIRPRDVLYLPPSNIADVEKFMVRIDNILSPILALERGLIFWPSFVDAIKGDTVNVSVPLQ